MLKRDNWTTQELVDLLRARKLPEDVITAISGTHNGNRERAALERRLCEEYNLAIDGLVEDFEACLYPEDIMGAFAYDTERKEFVHIGQFPEEDAIACKVRTIKKGTPIK